MILPSTSTAPFLEAVGQEQNCRITRRSKNCPGCAIYSSTNPPGWLIKGYFFYYCILLYSVRETAAFQRTDRSLFRPLSYPSSLNTSSTFGPASAISFDEWINRTQQHRGMFLNHSSYAEGEVLLFRTKKNRHRAIAIMSAQTSAKFSDSLTFKEWLRKVYSQDKALKVSIRSTEVVRQVLQHLYASKQGFRAPIIIHANTFDSGRHGLEKPVDPIVFIKTIHQLLPEAVVSLGWTPSADYSVVNRLDWSQTFRLVSFVYELEQPIILNMKLNDAVHSVDQLEWLLGMQHPSIYLVLKGEITDFVDSDAALQRLRNIGSSGPAAHKILFDVDETWKLRLDKAQMTLPSKKEKRSVEPERWRNFMFPSSYSMLSTSVVSSNGVAFLGWPNSLFVSTKEPAAYPFKQRISGKVMFLPKRQTREISPSKHSGMILQLFEGDAEQLESPRIPNSIDVFVGYDGKQQSTTQWPCYAFEVLDKGWRVELDIWSEECPDEDSQINSSGWRQDGRRKKPDWANYRTYLQLDTPVARSRKTRNVAIGKSGDGTIDFLFRELKHSGVWQHQMCWSLVLFSLPSHTVISPDG
uniref:Uncharacterized protein n=1 Tax=Ditylenchus dipsaci TaxID=166011 RepID=A0A915DAU8_9BILA